MSVSESAAGRQLDENGMIFVNISHGVSSAKIYLHGGHVTSWTVGGEEMLFLSKEAVFRPPKAIRGGIPICWPQFSDLGPLSTQHGFARNMPWMLEDLQSFPDKASAVFSLTSDGVKQALEADVIEGWPHEFSLTLKVSISDTGLSQEFTVTNTGAEPFEFTTALHTYFNVDSVESAALYGLDGVSYLDSLEGRVTKVESDSEEGVRFESEVDRIYLGAPRGITIKCGDVTGRKISVSTSSEFEDAVVWNPWAEKAARMGDYGDDEYREHVCYEVAACGNPVTLGPGQSWSGTQILCDKSSQA